MDINWVISKLIALKNLTLSETSEYELERFTIFTELLDEKRNQNLNNVFPEIGKHFSK